MEEDGKDEQRTDEAHHEYPYAIETVRHLIAIGEFILDEAMRHNPSYEYTRKERAKGKENIRCEVVAEVHHTHIAYLYTRHSTHRQ